LTLNQITAELLIYPHPFEGGDFKVFIGKSYFFVTRYKQLTCKEAGNRRQEAEGRKQKAVPMKKFFHHHA